MVFIQHCFVLKEVSELLCLSAMQRRFGEQPILIRQESTKDTIIQGQSLLRKVRQGRQSRPQGPRGRQKG